MKPSARNSALLVDLSLVIAVLLTRVFSFSHYLHKWDSVQFAIALTDFDISRHQPHPTGYPGYIALGWLIKQIVGDDNASLVIVGIISAMVISIGIHRIGRMLFGPRGGVIAGFLAAFNPLLWYFSSIALSYIAGLAFAVLAVAFSVGFKGKTRLLAPLLAGLASTVWLPAGILIAPVLIWSIFSEKIPDHPKKKSKINFTTLLAWIGIFIIPILIFYIPVILNTGGLSSYLAEIRSESGKHVLRFSNWASNPAAEFLANTGSLYGLIAKGFGITAILYVLSFIPFRKNSFEPAVKPVPLLILWIVPGFLLFTIVYINYVGILIFFLPALILLFTLGLERIISAVPSKYSGFAALILILAFIGYFSWTFTTSQSDESLYSIIRNDNFISDTVRAVKLSPDSPKDLLILGDSGGYRHWSYYFPVSKIIWTKYLLYFPVKEDLGVWGSKNRIQDRFYPDMSPTPDHSEFTARIPIENSKGLIIFKDDMARWRGAGRILALGVDTQTGGVANLDFKSGEAATIFPNNYQGLVDRLGDEPEAYYMDLSGKSTIVFSLGSWWAE